MGIPTWCPPQAAEHSNSVLRAELQRPVGLQVRPRGQQGRGPRTDPSMAPRLVGDGARAPDTRKVGVTPTQQEQSQTLLPRGPVARLHCVFNAVTKKTVGKRKPDWIGCRGEREVRRWRHDGENFPEA